MNFIGLLSAIPVLIGMYFVGRGIESRLKKVARFSGNASKIAVLAVLISAGFAVIAPSTGIRLLTTPAFVVYMYFLVVGLLHLWRWVVAIRSSEKKTPVK